MEIIIVFSIKGVIAVLSGFVLVASYIIIHGDSKYLPTDFESKADAIKHCEQLIISSGGIIHNQTIYSTSALKFRAINETHKAIQYLVNYEGYTLQNI